jgi:tetratricopeptide (TPR) repeat protein
MPPEQATGGQITAKADLYSLGAMLYEMVTGRPPFLGDDEIAIISQHINTPPVAPTWHASDCPRPLEALIVRLLSKDPSERPESAQDVYNALDAIDLTSRGETVERQTNSLDSLAGGVFVGRQAEMDQIKAALEDVLGGRGRLVTLVGEPGIGKTRTSEELATYAGLRGAQVLWGRCYEGGGAPPYWPWVQAIRSYVREIDPDELRRQMGSSASVVSESVADVKDRLPEIQAPAPMDNPESARFRLFDSITSFLKSASQSQPIVIVLDDLHWSDQPTLTFLEFIARELNQSRVLIVGTYRDMELNRRHPLSVTLGDLARERLYERVLLRGLTETDIARFVEITAGFKAPRELSSTVHRHTEGNPLFVTEVVRDLVQTGELTEEKVSGRSSWSVRIPEGVREVIGRRLDRLSDRANEVFTTAAIVGREFTLDALKELSEDTTEGQLLDVLDEALNAKLIEELPDQVGLYQFTHALVQETLTGELSLTRRVRLHGRIAEVLEGMYGDQADAHAAELARHFGEAEAVVGSDRLVHYLMVAGSELLEVYGHTEALVHYERAYAAVGTDVRDHRLGEILMGLGRARAHALDRVDLQQAVNALTEAFDVFLELDDQESAVRVALTNMPNAHGPSGMADLMDRAIAIVTKDSSEHAYLLAQYFQWPSFERAEYASDAIKSALDVDTSIPDDPLALKIIATSLSPQMQHQDYEAIQVSVDHGLELLMRVDDPFSEAMIRESHSLLAYRSGNRDKGSEIATAAVSAAERTRSQFRIANALVLQAWQFWYTGHVATAVDSLERGLDLAPTEIRLLSRRAIIAFFLGDFERGRECLSVFMNIDSIGDIYVNPFSTSTSLFCEQAGGVRVGEPLVLDSLVQFAADETVEPGLRSQAYASLAVAATLGYDVGDARSVYDKLQASAVGYFDGIIPHALILARLSVHLGNLDDAEAGFKEIVESSLANNHIPQIAEACADYAELLLDRDEPGYREKATALQDEALVITRYMGMKPLTERILRRREMLKA